MQLPSRRPISSISRVIGMQVAGASLSMVFNMGGSAVANYASVLEAV